MRGYVSIINQSIMVSRLFLCIHFHPILCIVNIINPESWSRTWMRKFPCSAWVQSSCLQWNWTQILKSINPFSDYSYVCQRKHIASRWFGVKSRKVSHYIYNQTLCLMHNFHTIFCQFILNQHVCYLMV